MDRTKRNLLIGLLIGGVVMAATALAGDLSKVTSLITAFDWRLTPWILGGACFSYAVRLVKWHYLVGRAGGRDLSLADDTRIFLSGFPLSVTPGKVGEALKAVWLNQTAGWPVSRGLSVVVVDRISDGLAMLMLSTLGVVSLPQAWPAFGLSAGVLILVVLLSQFRRLTLHLLDRAQHLPVVGHLVPAAARFYEASHSLLRPTSTMVAVLLGCVAWFGEGAATFGVLVGLGLPPSAGLLSLAVFAFAFSTIIGALSALPGGLGATEASLAGLLVLLVPLPTATAATATLLLRLATLWFAVLIGLVTWALSPGLVFGQVSRTQTKFVKEGTIAESSAGEAAGSRPS